ncbi:TVP38/TMEM64 family protein [Oceanobacillus polygoni]|uniref:TVP38/TMEM64 family membrane protein n=1 Tax=Oceanobacillus polygoni TaxID=1235259 RepID=A0A9X0YRG7_9BACI|nr:TVP38/TMEM64 family protein [Oceanobacillus polygoni]MBP2076627.1 putative membrane protein YdjX (TVP38/TMEM64 family) [Oceanobacillus polygoni]
MYLSNINFSNWKNVLETEGLEDFIQQLLRQYEGLGPLPGILLPFIEAFLPFLPLIVFVLGNAAAYGLLEGFLFSWIGASSGAVVVFIVIRRLGNTKLFLKIRKNNQVKRITAWVERHGFGPLFLLLCFPFSPSAIINVVAGLSKVSTHQFILAVFLGKAVMIFSISYVGSSIMEFAKNPVRTIVVGIGIFLFWMLGKYLEQKLQKRVVEKAYPNRKKD